MNLVFHVLLSIILLLKTHNIKVAAEAYPDPSFNWIWPSKTEHNRKGIESRYPEVNDQSLVKREEWLSSIRHQSEQELNLLEQGKRSILKYESNSQDCYKNAALALKIGCKELEIGQEQKMQYAIRLTLCEVGTANMIVPESCTIPNPSTSCVEGLSLNPQLWTSYSGYFREVMTMCMAVKHQIEMDLIESLIYNHTVSQLLNTNILEKHAESMADLHLKELKQYTQMQTAQTKLQTDLTQLNDFVTNLTSSTNAIAQKLANAIDALTKFDSVKDMMMDTFQKRMHALNSDIKYTSDTVKDVRTEIAAVQSQAKTVFQQHVHTQSLLTGVMNELVHLKSATQTQSKDLSNTFTHFQKQIEALSHAQISNFQNLSNVSTELQSQQRFVLSNMTSWFATMQEKQSDVMSNYTLLSDELVSKQLEHQHHLNSISQAFMSVQQVAEMAGQSFRVATRLTSLVFGMGAKLTAICVMSIAIGIVFRKRIGGALLTCFGLVGLDFISKGFSQYQDIVIGSILVCGICGCIALAYLVWRKKSRVQHDINPGYLIDKPTIPARINLEYMEQRGQWRRYRPSQQIANKSKDYKLLE